jgi:hypothetical protein
MATGYPPIHEVAKHHGELATFGVWGGRFRWWRFLYGLVLLGFRLLGCLVGL